MGNTTPDNISYPSNTDEQKTIEQRIEDTAVSVQAAFNTRAISQNYIINGGMDIWQRGTSVTLSSTQPFGPDRWRYGHSRFGPTSSVTFSQQAFTLGSFPASGVKSYARITSSESQFPGDFVEFSQRIEDVTILAGKTVTFSFWANFPSSGRTVSIGFSAGNVSGGNSSPFALTTTSISGWNRYTATFNLPNLSGSTVSANNYFSLAVRYFAANLGETVYLEFTGVQLEEGSYATPFRRNSPSIQAELAACQRYYWRYTETINYRFLSSALSWGGNEAVIAIKLPVTMRANPSTSISNLSGVYWLGNGTNYTNASNFNQYNTVETWGMYCTLTVPQNTALMFRMPVNSYIEASAEL